MLRLRLLGAIVSGTIISHFILQTKFPLLKLLKVVRLECTDLLWKQANGAGKLAVQPQSIFIMYSFMSSLLFNFSLFLSSRPKNLELHTVSGWHSHLLYSAKKIISLLNITHEPRALRTFFLNISHFLRNRIYRELTACSNNTLCKQQIKNKWIQQTVDTLILSGAQIHFFL